jgi:hypothetical protein
VYRRAQSGDNNFTFLDEFGFVRTKTVLLIKFEFSLCMLEITLLCEWSLLDCPTADETLKKKRIE